MASGGWKQLPLRLACSGVRTGVLLGGRPSPKSLAPGGSIPSRGYPNPIYLRFCAAHCLYLGIYVAWWSSASSVAG
eukprot:6719239-Alexandrium_andersonii.AAC.1